MFHLDYKRRNVINTTEMPFLMGQTGKNTKVWQYMDAAGKAQGKQAPGEEKTVPTTFVGGEGSGWHCPPPDSHAFTCGLSNPIFRKIPHRYTGKIQTDKLLLIPWTGKNPNAHHRGLTEARWSLHTGETACNSEGGRYTYLHIHL